MQDLLEGKETMLLDPKSGQVVSLNPTAAAIWYLCDGERDATAIAKEILQTVPGPDPRSVEADVGRILQDLSLRGFLV